MKNERSLLARVFLAVEGLSRRHHRLVILLAIGVFLVGTTLSLTLTFQTDVMDLLPQKEPAVQAFRRTAARFGALDTFPVAIDSPDPRYDAEDYEDYADDLARRLREDPAIGAVDSGIDPNSPLVHYFQERLPLFLDQGGIVELRERLTDPEIKTAVQDAKHLMEVVPSPELKDLLRRDPLRLSTLLLRRFAGAKGSSLAQWTEGHVVSKDGQAILLLIRPSRPAQDVTSAKDLVGRVRAAIAAADDAQRRKDPELPLPKTLLGGRYAISVEDSQLILGDIGKTMTFSFLGVVALYFFCYRRLGAILYSVLPLLLGQCLTFTLARLCYGSLNSATATSAALLMGLGTDFTIVMYARYVEERRAGKTLDEASRIMMGETALGVYTGALTSAGTFGALVATSFVGLKQFGFLVGGGILLCLASILLLLPALVIAFESKREKSPRLYVHSFGIERIIPVSRRWPKTVVALSAVVTIAAIVLALRLKLSENVETLRSEHNAGINAQEQIKERFGHDPNFMMVMTEGDDPAETDARARRVEARLAAMRDAGTLKRYEALGTILPDAASQEANRQALAQGGADFDPDRVEASVRQALRDAGFKEDGFAEGLQALRRSLRPEGIVTEKDLLDHGGGDIIGRFARHGESHARVAYAYGDVDAAALKDLQAADPTVTVAGVALLSRALKHVLRHDVMVCLGLGFVLVAILLVLDFGSWTLAALALMQLLVGLAWMLGGMGLLHVPLTMVNSFAAALLMGVGIDYGIHMLHRLHGPDAGNAEGVAETGKAVAMAAMTNVVGFGVLLTSNYPGLRGLGAAAVLGSIGCLITALTLMPAVEVLLGKRLDRKVAVGKVAP